MAFSKLLSKNVQLGPPLRSTAWRKIALGTWRSAKDPTVYSIIEVDAEPLLALIESERERSGEKITMTHFVGKAIGMVMAKHPQINCVRRWGRIYPRIGADVFFQVASDKKGDDLAGITIRAIDQKPLSDIAKEMRLRVEKIRAHGDQEFGKFKGVLSILPGLLAGPFLDIGGFILYKLNLWSSLMGSPKDAFGGCMVTNIGSLGLDMALPPLVDYSNAPLLLAVGAVKPSPWVLDNGTLAVRKIMKIGVTFDHRLIDGVHASHMYRTLMEIFKNPQAAL